MQKFTFVTGYPRSRTCWLSELLTCRGHSFAFHEANLKCGNNFIEWRKRLEDRKEEYVIDCNSSVPFFYNSREFRETFFDFGYVVIKRHPIDAKNSYKEFCKKAKIHIDVDALWQMMRASLDLIVEEHEALVVNYDNLIESRPCKRIANFCANDFPWDQDRFDELQKKVITQNIDICLGILELV